MIATIDAPSRPATRTTVSDRCANLRRWLVTYRHGQFDAGRRTVCAFDAAHARRIVLRAYFGRRVVGRAAPPDWTSKAVPLGTSTRPRRCL